MIETENEIPSLDELNQMLKPEQKQEHTELDVLKELFKSKDVETKTELTEKQVFLINQKRLIAKLLGFKNLKYALDDYMLLMISKDRQGRREFIDGFKAQREHNEDLAGKGMFSGFKEKLGFK